VVLQQKHKITQCLENQLTQHATVCNCAKEGKYFCFWASDPHNAKLDSQSYKISGTINIMSSNTNGTKFRELFKRNETRLLPIVSIAKDEWTKIKVEQLASTLATSATAIALPVIERPGQP